jgi:hypothetical protein
MDDRRHSECNPTKPNTLKILAKRTVVPIGCILYEFLEKAFIILKTVRVFRQCKVAWKLIALANPSQDFTDRH